MSERSVEYILIGHPAWPDPIVTHDGEFARSWFEEHRNSGHPIRVDRRQIVRTRFLSTEQSEDI